MKVIIKKDNIKPCKNRVGHGEYYLTTAPSLFMTDKSIPSLWRNNKSKMKVG